MYWQCFVLKEILDFYQIYSAAGYLNTGKTRKDAKRRGKKQKDAKRPGNVQKDAERRKKTAKRPRKLAKRPPKMYCIRVSSSRNSLQMYLWIFLDKRRI